MLRSFIATFIVFTTIVTARAYNTEASCDLKWLAGYARSAAVGVSTEATYKATSSSESISIMRLEAWARWEPNIYPWTKESSINLAPGKSGTIVEPMSKKSCFRVELRPDDFSNRAKGNGNVKIN